MSKSTAFRMEVGRRHFSWLSFSVVFASHLFDNCRVNAELNECPLSAISGRLQATATGQTWTFVSDLYRPEAVPQELATL